MAILEHLDARARLAGASSRPTRPIVAFQGHPRQHRRHDRPCSTTPANVSTTGPDAAI